jgi:hypothetical protein
MVYQISVFLENRAGQFAEITKILAENSIDFEKMTPQPGMNRPRLFPS